MNIDAAFVSPDPEIRQNLLLARTSLMAAISGLAMATAQLIQEGIRNGDCRIPQGDLQLVLIELEVLAQKLDQTIKEITGR